MGKPARAEHNQPNSQKNQRCAVIALDVDGRRGQRNVQKQKQQVLGPVDLPAHPAQMQRQRQDKADFCQLRRLEGHTAHPVPAVVGGAARIIPDGDQPGVYVVQKQRGQHQPPRHCGVQRPCVGQRVVVHRGENHRQHHAQQAGDKLHRRLVVGAQLCLPDGDQHHHAERRARRAEQQIKHIDPAQIPADKRIHQAASFLL